MKALLLCLVGIVLGHSNLLAQETEFIHVRRFELTEKTIHDGQFRVITDESGKLWANGQFEVTRRDETSASADYLPFYAQVHLRYTTTSAYDAERVQQGKIPGLSYLGMVKESNGIVHYKIGVAQ